MKSVVIVSFRVPSSDRFGQNIFEKRVNELNKQGKRHLFPGKLKKFGYFKGVLANLPGKSFPKRPNFSNLTRKRARWLTWFLFKTTISMFRLPDVHSQSTVKNFFCGNQD